MVARTTALTSAILWILTGCASQEAVTPAPGVRSPETQVNPDDNASEPNEQVVTPPADEKPAAQPAAVAALAACTDGRRHFAIVDRGFFSWTVTKVDSTPVTGVHAVTGELTLATVTPLVAPGLRLAFSRDGAFTGQEVRDQRLGSAFFGLGDKLVFILERVTPKNGKLELPEVGSAAELDLNGSLEVAGIRVPVRVPVVVASRPDGLHVSEGVSGAMYRMRSDWGLAAPLDAFLALAGAKINEFVALRFELDLRETCSF